MYCTAYWRRNAATRARPRAAADGPAVRAASAGVLAPLLPRRSAPWRARHINLAGMGSILAEDLLMDSGTQRLRDSRGSPVTDDKGRRVVGSISIQQLTEIRDIQHARAEIEKKRWSSGRICGDVCGHFWGPGVGGFCCILVVGAAILALKSLLPQLLER